MCSSDLTIEEKRFNPISIVRADPSFPRFFPYKVVAGDINKALTQPNAIALTEYQAKIFFGNEDPIGKTFSAKYAYENETITYEVAAVIKEYPQSSFSFWVNVSMLKRSFTSNKVGPPLNWEVVPANALNFKNDWGYSLITAALPYYW